jgi:hypothetical protein
MQRKMSIGIVAVVALAAVILAVEAAPTSATAQAAGAPGIPTVVAKLYFGVLGGNGYRPERVAVDSQRQRIYTVNLGAWFRIPES